MGFEQKVRTVYRMYMYINTFVLVLVKIIIMYSTC